MKILLNARHQSLNYKVQTVADREGRPSVTIDVENAMVLVYIDYTYEFVPISELEAAWRLVKAAREGNR